MSRSLKPQYKGESNFKKKVRLSVTEADVVARIVPPIAKFTDNPRAWMKFHAVHYGYKNMEGKSRPFASPYEINNKTKAVLVQDPARDRYLNLQNQLNKAKTDGNTPLMQKLLALVGFKGVYNLDKHYYLNVVLLDGTVGTLKIKHKMKLSLEDEIGRLKDSGVNPISEEDGRFFVFHKDGTNTEATFKVTEYKQTKEIAGVGKADVELKHVITPELWNKIEAEASDLENLFPTVTSEEIQQIVDESDLMTGKSPACNKFFDDRWKARRNNQSNEEVVDPNEADVQSVMNTFTQKNVTPGVGTMPLDNKTVLIETPSLVLPQTGTPVSVTPNHTVIAAPTHVEVVQSQSIGELSDAEFLKMIDM